MSRLLSRAWPALSGVEASIRLTVSPEYVWLLLSPVTVVSLASHLAPDNERVSAVLAATVGCLIGGGLLWITGKTVLAVRRDTPRPLWACACWWSFVGIVTYLAADVWLRWTDAEGDVGLELIRDSVRYGVVFGMRMVLLTILLSCLLGTRRLLLSLSRLTVAQQLAVERTSEYLLALKAKYSGFVQESIEPKLHALMADLAEMSQQVDVQEDEKKLAESIRTFGAGKVRELSHLVADDSMTTWNPSDTSNTVEQAVEVQESPLHGWLAKVPPPLAVVEWLLVLRLGFGSFEMPDLATIAWGIALLLFVFLVLFLGGLIGKRLSERAMHGQPWVGAGVIVTLLVGSTVMAHFYSGLDDELVITRLAIVLHVMAALFTVWLVNYAVLRYQDVTGELNHVSRATEALKLEKELAAQRIRQQLAAVLHGPIQGRLALASMTLRQGVADPRYVDPAFRGAMLARVYSLLASVDEEVSGLSHVEPTVLPFDQFMTRLEREWTGILEVQTLVTEKAALLLASERSLDESTVHIVEEAIMNARRHGGARVMYVSVATSDESDRELLVTVLDDGCGVAAEYEAGLGGQLFDQLTSRWSLAPTRFGGTAFTASIPVMHGPHAPSPTMVMATA